MYKILSVDDEPINQAIVEELFRAKFNVALASSGEECINNIENIKPDLILLDVSMVGMDGYETCQKLKQIENFQNIPVIFVSARGSLEDKAKAYEAGGYDYIIKPFNHAELELRIEKTIKKLKQQDNTLHKPAPPEAHHEETKIIIQFLSSCCTEISLEQLGDLLTQSCLGLGLDCVFQIRHNSTRNNFSTKNLISPLEQSLLCEQTNEGIHFFDFDSKTLISHSQISLLINGMPVDDLIQHKNLKELLGMMLDAAESRIKSLINEMALKQQQDTILDIIKVSLVEFGDHSGVSTVEVINTIRAKIKKLM
ncbi:MAG: response regulator [Gammaproteobacteria bacterium]|nr:response regulator [Gammaproteobacteria bacterium]